MTISGSTVAIIGRGRLRIRVGVYVSSLPF